jgi:hypothetical protein
MPSSIDLGGRPSATRTTTARSERSGLCPSAVPATLGLTFSLAVAGDALLRGGLGGAAFPLWMVMTAAALLALAGRAGRVVPRETAAWLVTAVLFSGALAWRESEELQAYDFLATLFALMMASAALASHRAALFAARLRVMVRSVLRAAGSTAVGFVALVLRDAAARYEPARWSVPVRVGFRVAFVVGGLTLVFGSLLSHADPIFASFISLPRFDVSTLVQHGVVIAFLTWTLGGWTRGALAERPETPVQFAALPWRLGTLEITTGFATLIVLFGAFIVAQLGWLFGGEAFLRARTGLTAAQYARQGFFQMVFVVALVIPLLVATRAALAPGWALARRHSRLAMPVVALVGAIVLSAALRLQLYVRYYGLSTDRLYALVFMGWLAFVLLWLSLTTLRGRPRRFGPGVVLSALVTLGGVNVVVPDVVVARVNVARSAGSSAPLLDVYYLATLSAEAAHITIPAILAAPPAAWASSSAYGGHDSAPTKCTTIGALRWRWGPASKARLNRKELGAWRTWNAGEAHALAVAARYQTKLDAAAREACPAADAAKPAAQR